MESMSSRQRRGQLHRFRMKFGIPVGAMKPSRRKCFWQEGLGNLDSRVNYILVTGQKRSQKYSKRFAKAARAVVGSSLLKAAVHGEDPNWGRVFAALGNSGAQVDSGSAALWIGSVQVARDGVGTGVSKDEARAQMHGAEVTIRVDLGLGSSSARAWGCDLTEAYVVENSAYST